MSKYTWLFVMLMLAIVITFVAQSLESISIANEIDRTLDGDMTLNADGISGFVRTYLRLLVFSVEGIPDIIYMFFIPINLVIGVIIGELVIKVVEAIIPF